MEERLFRLFLDRTNVVLVGCRCWCTGRPASTPSLRLILKMSIWWYSRSHGRTPLHKGVYSRISALQSMPLVAQLLLRRLESLMHIYISSRAVKSFQEPSACKEAVHISSKFSARAERMPAVFIESCQLQLLCVMRMLGHGPLELDKSIMGSDWVREARLA